MYKTTGDYWRPFNGSTIDAVARGNPPDTMNCITVTPHASRRNRCPAITRTFLDIVCLSRGEQTVVHRFGYLIDV